MAASSISNTQYSPASQLSQLETSRPAPASASAPNEPARPQLGAAARDVASPPPSDSGRGQNVDVVA